MIGDLNAHTVPSGTYTFQLTATVNSVTSSSPVSIDIFVCQVMGSILISGGPVISSMTVTFSSNNPNVDLLEASGSPLTTTMLDIAGDEMTTAGMASICESNLPLTTVWSMTSVDSTLNSLADRPKLDSTSSPPT